MPHIQSCVQLWNWLSNDFIKMHLLRNWKFHVKLHKWKSAKHKFWFNFFFLLCFCFCQCYYWVISFSLSTYLRFLLAAYFHLLKLIKRDNETASSNHGIKVNSQKFLKWGQVFGFPLSSTDLLLIFAGFFLQFYFAKN